MYTVSRSQIDMLLWKYNKRLKNGKQYENQAHQITLDYMMEMLETRFQPYMEEPLVHLLSDVTEEIN